MSFEEALPAYEELCNQPQYDDNTTTTSSLVDASIVVSVAVNGTTYTLQPTGGSILGATEVSPLLSTAEFIRTFTQWHGTKVACAEGGCGACTVAVTYLDHTTGKAATVGINACLRPILACNGMAITTNDGLVSEQASNANERVYNPIQSTLAAHNGSQCGYCSNGFVMTMYTFLAEKSQRGGAVDALSIEEAFDGNLCRCTGYRPILDAMKSFAGGNSNLGDIFNNGPGLRECQKTGCCQKKIKFNFEHLPDMEDVSKYLGDDAKVETGVQVDHKGCMSAIDRKRLLHILERDVSLVQAMNGASTPAVTKTASTTTTAVSSSPDPKWIACDTVADLETNLVAYSGQASKPSIMLVNGQTSLGVYKNTSADVRLYIGAIPDFKQITNSVAEGITIGSTVTIADVIAYLESVPSPAAGSPYLVNHFPQAVKHLKRIAGRQVRSVGSLCGNLMVAYAHQDPVNGFFCSDAATVMMGLGAVVRIITPATKAVETLTMSQFLALNGAADGMYGKYINSITIPWAAQNEVFMSYKIAMRQVNSHAYVNAAMKAVVDPNTGVIAAGSTIVIGGIQPQATRYTAVESAMTGLQVKDTASFQTVANTLLSLLNPCAFTAKEQFRVSAAVNYFYKFFLYLQGGALPTTLSTGANCWMTRGISSGTQQFQPDPKIYPVSAGIPKIEGIQQTSGFAKYSGDEAMPMGTLHVRVVLATQATATFSALDISGCSSVPGYVNFVSAKDLTTTTNKWNNGAVFINIGDIVEYSGQCVGAVICTSEVACDQAAKMVNITYTDMKTPIISMADAIIKNSIFPASVNPPPVQRGNVTNPLAGSANVVSGSTDLGYQYQFHLENHICTITPKEDTLEVRAATQMPVQVQMAVAATIGLPSSKVNVSVRRCGGGFGGKITNSIFPAIVAAAACGKTNRPVTLTIPFDQATSLLGFRGGWHIDYKIGFDTNNKITGMSAQLFGASGNVPSAAGHVKVALHSLENAYHIPNANFECGGVLRMNIAGAASVRGPGWVPGMALMESIMSNSASQLGVDPSELRANNLMERGQTTCDGMPLPYMNIQQIWSQIKVSSKYTEKQASVAAYNNSNRWTKRGLAITPIRFGMQCAGANFNASVSIYPDGTVGINHGGSEIGQGLNTKVIQVVAYKLGLTEADLVKVTCNETSTRDLSSPSNVTGGSITGSMCSLALMHACDELNRRLAPFRTSPTMPWLDLITAADNANVNLHAAGWSNAPASTGPSMFRFNTCAASLCEVELDGLTGQYEVKEVDILFDAGISLNPIIDIGQVEGGFIFGMGLFTSEEMAWDPKTAQPLNGTTWDYKVPSAFDVPESFNIALLKDCPNPLGVLGAKVVGEPGVAMATSVWTAIEDAVTAVRIANGGPSARWVCTNLPLTVDKIQQACGTTVANFEL